jgi:glycerol-1-phosphate dehydrogenase [NAD(P)+]
MIAESIAAAMRQATDTREVLIGEGVLRESGHVFRRNFGQATAALVADENTYRAAGETARDVLLQAGVRLEATHVFPGSPRLHPEIERVEEVRHLLGESQAIPFVVGSGTLNDIVKLAAHQVGRPYMVVATAASMDGYTSFAAAITHAGVKRVDACPAPRALVADVQVLADAPAELTSSGYGDLAGKVISGADWMIADALGMDPIHRPAWDLIQPQLREWIAEPQRLADGDRAALERLLGGLVMAGLAMQAARSSWPASGSEHLFSHLWEMEGLPNAGREVSHGFKVALGAAASAAFYEKLLATDFSWLDVPARVRAWPAHHDLEAEVRRAFGLATLADSATEESLAKYGDPRRMGQHLTYIQKHWPAMRERLRAQLMPAAELAELLAQAGCPTTPEAVGLTRAALRQDYNRVRMLRRRYTALDLAFEAGVFPRLVEALFAPSGFWAQR